MVGQTGSVLDKGYIQPWCIGTGEATVDVSGMEHVTLSTQLKRKNGPPSLFWHGQVTTGNGDIIPLHKVPFGTDRMRDDQVRSTDYKGGSIDVAGTPLDKAVPAEPGNPASPGSNDRGEAGLITLDLSGMNAKKLNLTVGADHPVGKKPELREGLIVRETGKTARFLTVIEPFKNEGVVEAVKATGSDTVVVQLTDDRTHKFEFSGMSNKSGDIEVTMTRIQNGRTTTHTTGDKTK